MFRGLRCNTLLHDSRKFLMSSLSVGLNFLIGVRSQQLKGSVGLLVSTNLFFKLSLVLLKFFITACSAGSVACQSKARGAVKAIVPH